MDNNNLTPDNNSTNVNSSSEVFSLNEDTNTNVQGSSPNMQEITPQPAPTPNSNIEQVQPQSGVTAQPVMEEVKPQAPVTPNSSLGTVQPQPEMTPPIQNNISAQTPVQEPVTSQPTTTNTIPSNEVNTQNTNKNSAAPLILVLLAIIGGFAYYFIVVRGSNKVINDADITGYLCAGDTCKYNVLVDGQEVEYRFSAENEDLFEILNNYDDNIKVNINISTVDGKDTIVGYEIYNKNTNEKIENVKNEEELRTALGLHNEGTYTDVMTFVSMKDQPSYEFKSTVGAPGTANILYSCVFKDSKGNKLDMSYLGDGSGTKPELVQAQNYNVTYTVEKEIFDYTYTITSIS